MNIVDNNKSTVVEIKKIKARSPIKIVYNVNNDKPETNSTTKQQDEAVKSIKPIEKS
jgi:hypothetical protein